MSTASSSPYKKSWLISTMIAREMIGLSEGDRLPTIAEYAQSFDSSRGIVQNALAMLQQQGAIGLEKRGKVGTFVTRLNLPLLFELANLQYITASMAPPLNPYFSSLATGVCASIAECPATFNFGFMHSSESRAKALVRHVYDFIIVSQHSAQVLVQRYPELEIAFALKKSIYSPRFILCSNRKGVRQISDGDRIVADKYSNDQYEITLRLCKGKHITIIQEPYLNAHNIYDQGKADFIVQREDEYKKKDTEEWIAIEDQDLDMTFPAVVINKDSYGMEAILRRYLVDDVIAHVQAEVRAGRQQVSFY